MLLSFSLPQLLVLPAWWGLTYLFVGLVGTGILFTRPRHWGPLPTRTYLARLGAIALLLAAAFWHLPVIGWVGSLLMAAQLGRLAAERVRRRDELRG